jgi:hypothetical protein
MADFRASGRNSSSMGFFSGQSSISHSRTTTSGGVVDNKKISDCNYEEVHSNEEETQEGDKIEDLSNSSRSNFQNLNDESPDVHADKFSKRPVNNASIFNASTPLEYILNRNCSPCDNAANLPGRRKKTASIGVRESRRPIASRPSLHRGSSALKDTRCAQNDAIGD